MIRSTLAFIYSPQLNKVLLIKKQRPTFHKDKLNGLGGKFEAGETALECVQREVKEEANLSIPKSDWKLMGKLSWTEWQVEVFAAIYQKSFGDAKSLTSDPISWYPINDLPPNIISNLTWLIPLGTDVLQETTHLTINIDYR